jgi:Bacterial mobilisation protein (MobC)
MHNTDRPIKFTVRFTQDESLDLAKLAALHGVGQAEFIRRLIAGKSIPSAIPSIPEVTQDTYIELTRIKTELSRWGNNLNQLTKLANADRIPPTMNSDLTKIGYELGEIKKSINQLHTRGWGR